MSDKPTIAELAETKAELLEELRVVNGEIASRAGEVDEPDDESTQDFDTETTGMETADDKAAANTETPGTAKH